jgi:predicted PurR-regulated permease PerM
LEKNLVVTEPRLPHDSPIASDEQNAGRWTREHALVVVLVAATALLLGLCALFARPFLGSLAWALALAIVAHPLHRWFKRRIGNANVASGMAVILITLLIVGPALLVVQNVVLEAGAGLKTIEAGVQSGEWRAAIERNPRLAPALRTLETQAQLGAQAQALAAKVGEWLTKIVTGSAWAVVELLLTLFLLFYFFRDREKVLAALRGLVPLSEQETDKVFARVADTVHATVFGTLVVALVQGTLGGLMFWWLGLPAPVLWGAIMALLAIVPVLGAFVIWVPAAIALALAGQWGKAAILLVWGGVVIALIDNLLYPILVGKRLRLHTVPVFIAIVGGLAVFGAAGLILGPVVLALTDAIVQIWRRRTADGGTAENRV